MTITYRIEKGSPLTINELDDNFHDLDDRVQAIEDNPPEARSISEITQSGDSLFIEMTDSTQEGPFTLPAVSLNFRGEWADATVYLVNDLFTANGNVYIVLFNHTSEAPFDPNANNGSGQDFYGLLLEMPELTLPQGGGEGFVLTKASSSDFDTQWMNAGVPVGGDAGDVLTKSSGDDYDTLWQSPTFVPPVEEISASSFSPALEDANTYFRCTNTSGCVVTLQHSSDVAFPLGTELVFRQCVFGPVELTAVNGVQLNGIEGFDTVTDQRGAILHCKLVSVASSATEDDEWDVWGLLTTFSSDTSDASI